MMLKSLLARLSLLTLLALSTGLACATPPLLARPSQLAGLTLQDTQVIPADDIDGQRPIELSGLAWDPVASHLYAVSDRGRLFKFSLQVRSGRMTRLMPLSGAQIGGARKPNPEALWLRQGQQGRRGDGELVLADESSIDALIVDHQGQPKRSEALPEPLREPARWHDATSGVEALTWHPLHGLMAAPQRPLRGSPPGVHQVYARSGQVWAFVAHPGGPSSIKAIELVDPGRLLVLEKVKQGAAHLTVLRELALDGCPREAPCAAPAALLQDPRIGPGDNFEGLACIDREQCLLVTDSGGSSAGRTLLALVHLVRR